VSANFIAVLAIVTISLTIHLIVRYREILRATPEIDHAAHVADTMRSKFAPCFYTALTTIVAFGSLVASRIVPVADFGWMMCLGVVFAFAVTYSFFPAMLLVIGKGTPSKTLGRRLGVVNAALDVAQRRSGTVMIVALVTFVVAVFGITRLTLNDRFVDYFDERTDIHAGMRFIDAELGGTAPLDVIVSVAPYEAQVLNAEDDFATDEDDPFPERYWFTPDKLALIDRLHGFIEDHPAVGKVISIATLDRIGRTFNEGAPLDALQIMAALDAFPESVRDELIAPYASPTTGELRISARIIESGPTFSRDQLLLDIHQFAEQELGLEASAVQATGMFVLFNDMLTQLLSSQTSTLLYVLAATFVMFTVLLRSVVLGLIGMVPNILAAAWVLGIMGLAGIPLDMMTITIAAITIGIGVDNTIHYLHRYRDEYQQAQDVGAAARLAGASVGRAMYFTSMTITAGFSVLAFSNFAPTVNFGLLAALAMILAIVADLTVLPSLLIQSLGRFGPKASAGP
jgi:predicted RND superfamily exporter protein